MNLIVSSFWQWFITDTIMMGVGVTLMGMGIHKIIEGLRARRVKIHD